MAGLSSTTKPKRPIRYSVERDEKPSLLGAGATSAARRGDDPSTKPGCWSDVIADTTIQLIGVLLLEGAPIPFAGLAGLKDRPKDRLPGVRPAILDRAFGATPLVAGEEMRGRSARRSPSLHLLRTSRRGTAVLAWTFRLRSAERWKPP